MTEPTTLTDALTPLFVLTGIALCILAYGHAKRHRDRVGDAAPDLLSALKSLTDYADAGNDPDAMPEEARRIAVARAAIAKAEGSATPSSIGGDHGA